MTDFKTIELHPEYGHFITIEARNVGSSNPDAQIEISIEDRWVDGQKRTKNFNLYIPSDKAQDFIEAIIK